MKKIILFSISIFFLNCSYSQSFEGYVVYKNDVKSKNPKISKNQIFGLVGKLQKSFYNLEGDYVNALEGGIVRMQYYKNSENLIYNLLSSNDTLYYKDGSINNDPVLKFEIKRSVETVLDNRCDLLIVYSKHSISSFYFSKIYPINPELFKKHGFGNWYYVLQKTKSLPLKIVINTPQFTLSSTAIEVNSEKIRPEVFKIPKNAILRPYRW